MSYELLLILGVHKPNTQREEASSSCQFPPRAPGYTLHGSRYCTNSQPPSSNYINQVPMGSFLEFSLVPLKKKKKRGPGIQNTSARYPTGLLTALLKETSNTFSVQKFLPLIMLNYIAPRTPDIFTISYYLFVYLSRDICRYRLKQSLCYIA